MLSRMMNDFGYGSSFRPLLRLHDQVNRLFENFFEDLPTARPYGAAYPALNLWEDGDNAYVEAELPGLTLEDVEVMVTGDEVTINGARKLADAGGASWHRRERSQGQFSRRVALPWQIDADKVEARLTDGVLCIKLPKAERAKPKKVKLLT
jgi:HSP20 family protein